jgi:hypothetical protein
MYLFVRNRSAAPDRIFEAAAWAVEMAERVSGITGLQISANQAEYGKPLSSLSWSTTVGSYAEMGAAREKLLADPGYLEAIQAGNGLFDGPAEDALIDIIATAGDGGHRGAFASMITAQCAPGKIGEAMAFGVDIMIHVAGVTGRDGVFSRSMHGPWASVGWISLSDSLDEVDAATAALNADPDYVAKVDASKDLFLPGSGAGLLTRRIS